LSYEYDSLLLARPITDRVIISDVIAKTDSSGSIGINDVEMVKVDDNSSSYTIAVPKSVILAALLK
jgi:hypothetical protein